MNREGEAGTCHHHAAKLHGAPTAARGREEPGRRELGPGLAARPEPQLHRPGSRARGLLSLPSPLNTTPRHSQEFRAPTQGDSGGDTSGPQRDRQTDSPPQTGGGGKDTGPAIRCLSRRTAGLRPVRGSDPASRGLHPIAPGCQQPPPSSSDAERVNSRRLAPCPPPHSLSLLHKQPLIPYIPALSPRTVSCPTRADDDVSAVDSEQHSRGHGPHGNHDAPAGTHEVPRDPRQPSRTPGCSPRGPWKCLSQTGQNLT